MNCKDVQRCVHAFVDGELEPQEIIGLETHAAECVECRRLVEFERWFKDELRRNIGPISAPSALSGRISKSLDRAERTQQLRQLMPRAGLAATITVGVFAALVLPEWLLPSPEERSPDQRLVIDYVAERHARSLPVEVSGPDANDVSRWFRGKVDFAVQPPAFHTDQIQLVGGRISNVGDRQAAHLVYERHGRPVTLFVFEDSASIPVGGEIRQAGGHTVYWGQARGYNVAVWRQGGVSYAFSSDLDQSDMIRLVSSVQ